MAHEVFISYSRRDRTVAEAIRRALEARAVSVWIDHRDLTGGEDWRAAVSKAIDNTSVFVLLYSENSNTSKDVQREVTRADAKDKYIIPFRLIDVAFSPALEYVLSSKHWIDAFPLPLDPHLARLVDATLQVLPDRGPRSSKTQPAKGKPVVAQKQARPLEPAAKKSDHVTAAQWPKTWPLPGYAKIAIWGCVCAVVVIFGAILAGSGGDRAKSSEVEVPIVANAPRTPNPVIQDTLTTCTAFNSPCSPDVGNQYYSPLPGLTKIDGDAEVLTINTLKVDEKHIVRLAGVGAGTAGSVKKLAAWIRMDGNTVTCKPSVHAPAKYNCNVGTAHDDIAEYILSKGLASPLAEAD